MLDGAREKVKVEFIETQVVELRGIRVGAIGCAAVADALS